MPEARIIAGDALASMATLPDHSIDCILTDPPYFRVKGEAWDRQWENATAFLAWMAHLRDAWARLLAPNGSLYVFASPRMAARVEVCLGERFNVLNHIVWRKYAPGGGGRHASAHKESLRAFFPNTERIIFAEHYGADSMALGESGYAAQCEKAHGLVFEPLRAYLDGERRRAGVNKADCNVACGFSHSAGGMASRHYFSPSQWALPTAPHYAALQRLLNEQGRRPAPPFADFHPAASPYARWAGGEYLRADYEALRRPFAVTADVPYTDVWDFATVPAYAGKHPCEKPQDLLRHILRTSTRPGAVILDCFAGSGSTGVAALAEGRVPILIERDARYLPLIAHALGDAGRTVSEMTAPAKRRAPPIVPCQPPLFADPGARLTHAGYALTAEE